MAVDDLIKLLDSQGIPSTEPEKVVPYDGLLTPEVGRKVVRIFELGFQAGFTKYEIILISKMTFWKDWAFRAHKREWPYYQLMREIDVLEIKYLNELQNIVDIMGLLKIQVEVVRKTADKIIASFEMKEEEERALREAVDVSEFSIEELRNYISSGMTALPQRLINPRPPEEDELTEDEEV
jgi:hypothetical protein